MCITESSAVTPQRGFLLTIRSQPKHGLLYAALKQLGGGARLAEALGVCHASIWKWVNLREYPRSVFQGMGRFRPDRRERLDIALHEVLGVSIEDCWPPEVRRFIDETRELKSLIFEQTAEVPMERLTGRVMRSLTVEGQAETNVEQQELTERLEKVLKTLTYREREIIKLRFGLNGPAYTLEEVGQIFKVTKDRIRQIEAKALRKMAQASRAQQLKGFLEDESNDEDSGWRHPRLTSSPAKENTH